MAQNASRGAPRTNHFPGGPRGQHGHARFAEGQSVRTTRSLKSFRRGGPNGPAGKSHTPHDGQPRHGNTMNGMPGFIDADHGRDHELGKGGEGSGPKREGEIGERTGRRVSRIDKAEAPGTTAKSYRALNTGTPGGISKSLTRSEGLKTPHKHTANVSRGEGGARSNPRERGDIGSRGSGVGSDRTGHFGKGAGGHIPGGKHGKPAVGGLRISHNGGKMEQLAGKARTRSEGGGKRSVMY